MVRACECGLYNDGCDRVVGHCRKRRRCDARSAARSHLDGVGADEPPDGADGNGPAARPTAVARAAAHNQALGSTNPLMALTGMARRYA